jgi:hypothetical protein
MEQDLPPWSAEGKERCLRMMQNEVENSWAKKPTIRPSLVPFSTPAGPPTPIYQELDSAQSEIRILELSLSEDDTPITCNLVTVPMLETPEYIALSYEWGEIAETEEIFVNAHSFQARRNLVAALRQIRASCRAKTGEANKVRHKP